MRKKLASWTSSAAVISRWQLEIPALELVMKVRLPVWRGLLPALPVFLLTTLPRLRCLRPASSLSFSSSLSFVFSFSSISISSTPSPPPRFSSLGIKLLAIYLFWPLGTGALRLNSYFTFFLKSETKKGDQRNILSSSLRVTILTPSQNLRLFAVPLFWRAPGPAMPSSKSGMEGRTQGSVLSSGQTLVMACCCTRTTSRRVTAWS